MQLVCKIDTEAKSDDVEEVCEDLESSMEPDQAREAQQADRDRAEWEEHSECKPSHHTVSNEHGSLLGGRKAVVVEGGTVAAASR